MDVTTSTWYVAAGLLTGLLLITAIFFYYLFLVKKLIIEKPWIGKTNGMRLLNLGLTAVMFRTVLNVFIISPFIAAFKLANSCVLIAGLLWQPHLQSAAKGNHTTGDSGGFGIFQTLFHDIIDLFAPYSDHLTSNAFQIILAILFLGLLYGLENTLFWNQSKQQYSIEQLPITTQKTLGLLVVILIGFYLLFVAIVATTKISTSTFDPHITVNHLDSLLKGDINPDDIKKNMINSTDTAVDVKPFTLAIAQMDTLVATCPAANVQILNYDKYKNTERSFVASAVREVRQMVIAQNERVNKLLGQLNNVFNLVNNAYRENSAKLTNSQREKYVGELNDYYSNLLLSENDLLERGKSSTKYLQQDYEERLKSILINLQNARNSIINLKIDPAKGALPKQFDFGSVPQIYGGGDFGFGENFSSSSLSIPTPEKPSADWGFVGAMSSWLTDTTSLNLAIIIGMLGFGIFGAGISSFITKEVESTDVKISVLESMTSVIVKGFSAALVVYLVAKSGLALANNSNSDPNPYFLYFSCMAGAVFSDRIWEWARSIIDKNYNAQQAQVQNNNSKTGATNKDAPGGLKPDTTK